MVMMMVMMMVMTEMDMMEDGVVSFIYPGRPLNPDSDSANG